MAWTADSVEKAADIGKNPFIANGELHSPRFIGGYEALHIAREAQTHVQN